MEGRVVDAVAVDLADIEVLFYFGDMGGLDAVFLCGWCSY